MLIIPIIIDTHFASDDNNSSGFWPKEFEAPQNNNLAYPSTTHEPVPLTPNPLTYHYTPSQGTVLSSLSKSNQKQPTSFTLTSVSDEIAPSHPSQIRKLQLPTLYSPISSSPPENTSYLLRPSAILLSPSGNISTTISTESSITTDSENNDDTDNDEFKFYINNADELYK
jgi:hypothetical protein